MGEMIITQEKLRRTVLRGEIMALLHDVGKLSWPFVGTGTGQTSKEERKNSANLRAIHTTEFLPSELDKKPDVFRDGFLLSENEKEQLDTLRKRLRESAEDWLCDVPGTKVQGLGSLLYAHHKGEDFTPEKPYAHLIPLIMYADNADSLYSKGADSGKDQKLDLKQKRDIFLISPFGREQARIDRQSIEKDACELYKKLSDNLEGWESFSDEELPGKITRLRKTLRRYGKSNLAETRLPNNDVSLWQHSASVAGIFKALLAGRLLDEKWDSLLRNEDLAHAEQRLALLAFRWDSDAYMAHSLRAYEITGRQSRLEELADTLCNAVEMELALGNEIYRDRQGICFLVPNLPDINTDLANELKQKLIARMKDASRSIMGDELPWSVHIHPCGIQLDGMLSFWQEPGEAIASGPLDPIWKGEWQKGSQLRVCPRCGVHPLKVDSGRTGSRDDIACKCCQEIIQEGHTAQKDNRIGHPNKREENERFWDLLFPKAGANTQDSSANENPRVVLIQGIFSLNALQTQGEQDAWAHMVTPQSDKKTLPSQNEVAEAWRKAAELDGEDENLRTKFAGWLGQPTKNFCTSKEGWCRAGVLEMGLGARLKDFVKRMVFHEKMPSNDDEIAAGIILWGARQHPAPSRLARVWEELESFTSWASGRQGEIPLHKEISLPEWTLLPLTCDVNSFQIVVPARDAWCILNDITTAYEKRFGNVRHFLPLHLSATVFRRKAPLYIAMDAARRFRTLAKECIPKLWTLKKKIPEESAMCLVWSTDDGREALWRVPNRLPNTDENGRREDLFRTWYFEEGCPLPTHLSQMQEGKRYRVWPSTFDFEVLDASVRRYDIHYQGQKHREHYMMRGEGPRPYPLETIPFWNKQYLGKQSEVFKKDADSARQRKIALELLARLHLEWGWDDARKPDSILRSMMRDTLRVTMADLSEELLPAAVDGSFFDLCEWADFITK